MGASIHSHCDTLLVKMNNFDSKNHGNVLANLTNVLNKISYLRTFYSLSLEIPGTFLKIC